MLQNWQPTKTTYIDIWLSYIYILLYIISSNLYFIYFFVLQNIYFVLLLGAVASARQDLKPSSVFKVNN